jgi:hypothetical protein
LPLPFSSLFGALTSSTSTCSTHRHLASFAGPCFSPGSAHWPSQHGISRMRRSNLSRCLFCNDIENGRTRLIHRPAKDVSPPAGGTFASPFDGDIFRRCGQAAAGMLFSLVQRNSVPSLHMRCMITASLRASATFAFLRPRRLATFIAQAFSHDHFFVRVSMT